MATAFLLPLTHLYASLQALVAWIAPRPARRDRAAARAPAPRPAPCVAAKPLRVVRVLEPSAPRTVAGRMVISGRLADVCAELDRLAALEGR
ncbi:MAG: hypothetical protein KGL68_06305 [Burkholderiales bacterium]|nr:hypothetical protein [Burkholderiales bacterium]